MDRIKSAVIMALDFFKIIDGFEEQGKTHQPGGEEDNRKHNKEFVGKRPNWMPDCPCRISSPSRSPDPIYNPIKMENDTPKWKYLAYPPGSTP
jgi:hypothetical protein